MQTGDLVMFRGSGLMAWIVRAWTLSRWGHCGVLWMVEGMPMVIEAVPGQGVTVNALVNRQDDRPELVPTGRAVDLKQALGHCGDIYSFKDAVRAGLGQSGDHAGWECAELAACLLGLDHGAKGWTPQGVADVASKVGK